MQILPTVEAKVWPRSEATVRDREDFVPAAGTVSPESQRLEPFPGLLLGKAFLVGRLQAFLQTARLHLPQDEQARILAEELVNCEVELLSDASSREGAFQVGTRDELVTALGLALLEEPWDVELPIHLRNY